MAAPVAASAPGDSFFDKFLVLRSAPRELWLIYVAKIMEIAAYGLVSMGLMLYLINDVGVSEITAGSMIAGWSMSISLFTFLAGGLTDAIGIKKTFLYGYGLCAWSRLIAAFSDNEYVVVIASLAPMSVGLALMVPVMTAAVRRYTNKRQRSIGFSLYYVLMNVGFIVAGWLFDQMRNRMGKDGLLEVGPFALSVYQTIFLVAVAFTIAGLLPIWLLLRKGVEMDENGDTFSVDPAREKGEEGVGMWAAFWRVLVKTIGIFKEVMRESAFWRFLLLVSLVVGVKMVFYHMHYTLPPYADRELGYGSRFGTVWGVLNPGIIVLLVPIVGALAQKVSSYKMIVIGTSLCAVPTFMLVLPDDFFAFLLGTPIEPALKWFLDIDGDLSPLYITLTLFVALFSVGEALWSPRLYEYTASVAPKGREGTYMGMSVLPYFLAKFGVGPLSGVLIANFCPEEGARRSAAIWWVVAGIAIISPIFIVALKRVIQPRDRADEEHGGDAAPKEAKK